MSDNSKNTAVEQAASETSTQAAQGATDYGYVSNGNNSGNVRLRSAARDTHSTANH